jgi:hypothetical protein
MTSDSTSSWLMPIVFAGIASIRLIAVGSKVRVTGDRLIFVASLPHRLIILLGSAGAFAVMIFTWQSSQPWVRLGLGAGALGIALGWPPTIVLDRQGIQRKLWWRSQCAISWSEVSAIEENGVGNYQVYGQGQSSIMFSRFHIDPQRFKSEVIARTRLKVTKASDPVSVIQR